MEGKLLKLWLEKQVKQNAITLNNHPLDYYYKDLLDYLGIKVKEKAETVIENIITEGLTNSQERAMELFFGGKNLFITGKGGTGKSYLTRRIIEYCNQKNKNVIVCAPTGIAAQNINGATIHHTFQIKASICEPNSLCKNKKKLKVIKDADVIIIDEISMCRIDVFNFVCNTLHSLGNSCPQIIIVGDFYQLPPVLPYNSNEYDIWQRIPEYHDKIFAFESPYWNALNFITIELQEQMRQSEINYITCLDDIRKGVPNFDCFSENQDKDDTAITLCTTNKAATEINQEKMQYLISNGAVSKIFEAKEEGELKASDKQTESSLLLCEGARIIFLVNDTIGEQYFNGETGTIIKINDSSITVQKDDGKVVIVSQHEWTINEYESKVDSKTKEVKIKLKKIGSFIQIPVKLGWAITVHKSQGQTYDKVNIIPNNFFAEGQMYVALSRCKKLDGIHILGEFNPYQVKANKKVCEFMEVEAN